MNNESNNTPEIAEGLVERMAQSYLDEALHDTKTGITFDMVVIPTPDNIRSMKAALSVAIPEITKPLMEALEGLYDQTCPFEDDENDNLSRALNKARQALALWQPTYLPE